MGRPVPTLEEIREHVRKNAPHASAQEGTYHEILGPGATTRAVSEIRQALLEQPALQVCWIQPERNVFPQGLVQAEIPLAQVTWIQQRDPLWAIETALRSQIFGVIVFEGISSESLDEKHRRRFRMMAKQSGARLLLVAP